jgi:inhibitor of cysteine peptidase
VERNLQKEGKMKAQVNFFYFSLVLAFGIAVSLSNAEGSDKVAGAMQDVTVTEKNNNGTIEINKGDILVVRLESSPGTGYSWQVVKNDEKLMQLQGEPTLSTGPEQKVVMGGKEFTTFRFKARNSGTNVLELLYQRTWEKEKEHPKKILINVNIR